ncbi:MAG TPA: helix-turn-helix domain-containing protein [Bacillota bacterium]|nr:helix-turn-helix domain-containing protein [Bacillota bacterium]
MKGKKYLELRKFQAKKTFGDKEVDFSLSEKLSLDEGDLSKKICLHMGQDEDEIPLEYEGHIIGSIKLEKGDGRAKGSLDIAKPVMELLLRKALLVEEQQRDSQAKELLVSLLLNHKSRQSNPTLNILSRILGYDLEDPQVVFIAEFEKKDLFYEQSPEWNRLKSIAIKIIENFLKFSGGYIVVSYYNGRIVVLKNILIEEVAPEPAVKNGKEKGEPASRLRKQLISLAESLRQAILLGTKQDVSIGIGECHKGVLAVRNSYQDAYLALNMGKYFKDIKQSQIYHISDFALESLLSRIDEEEKERFVERYLGSIKGEKELQETLEAFFHNNLNIAQAAEKAFLHRNTFTYRLDKIQSLTGLNPRSFYDALILALALIMKQMDKHHPE